MRNARFAPPPRRRRSLGGPILIILILALIVGALLLSRIDTSRPTNRIEQDVTNAVLGH